MKKTDLIGTWKLVRHGKINASGAFIPTATTMNGRLLYSNDDRMGVLITKRPDATAVEHLITYFGRFTLEGNTIQHIVEVAPDPARIGKAEIRFGSLRGKELVLTTAPQDGEHYEIVWMREG